MNSKLNKDSTHKKMIFVAKKSFEDKEEAKSHTTRMLRKLTTMKKVNYIRANIAKEDTRWRAQGIIQCLGPYRINKINIEFPDHTFQPIGTSWEKAAALLPKPFEERGHIRKPGNVRNSRYAGKAPLKKCACGTAQSHKTNITMRPTCSTCIGWKIRNDETLRVYID